MKFLLKTALILLISVPSIAQARSYGVNIQAMYIDMDRTLLNSDHKISPKIIASLERYQRCGGMFGIATGRGQDQTKKYLSAINPKLPFVFNNGGLVMTPDLKQAVKVNSFSPKVLDIVKSLIPSINDNIVGITLTTSDGVIVDRDDKPFFDLIDKFDFTSARIDPSFTLSKDELPIILMFWTKRYKENNVKDLLDKKVGKMAYILAGPESVSITARGVDKSTGIEQALLGTGLTLQNDVVTLGDSSNDVGMLEKALYGFAMGNCKKEACTAADAIIKSNDTNAISKLIEQLAISRLCR